MTDMTTIENLPTVQEMIPQDRRLLPAPMAKLKEVGDMLAAAGALVPAPMRGKPDICLAVAYMAALHGTDPVATASQTYLVGDKIAFMAQYINAIVRGHLEGAPQYRYEGEGAQRFVTVLARPKGEPGPLTYTSPRIAQITVKNSPLWKTDPDQQLSYYAIRAWARRHMPGVLLGIYAVEELQQIAVRDVTPPRPSVFGDDTDLEEVEVTVDGEVEASFEPSGGFAPAEGPAAENATAPEQEEIADDPQEWFETMKARVDETADRAALDDLWRATRANHKRLNDTDRAAAADLGERFKARGKVFPPA